MSTSQRRVSYLYVDAYSPRGPSTEESRRPNDKNRGRVQEHDASIRGDSLSKNANKNSAAIGPAVWSERLTSNHYLRVGVTSGGSETVDPGSVL